jgi:hypothetical protein
MATKYTLELRNQVDRVYEVRTAPRLTSSPPLFRESRKSQGEARALNAVALPLTPSLPLDVESLYFGSIKSHLFP